MGTRTGTATIDDSDLLARADAGDLEAFRDLLTSHLHPAWRIATVVADDAAHAEAAVVTGMCDGLLATLRHPDPTTPLRVRLVGATRQVAAADADRRPTPTGPVDDPVVGAFRSLPQGWRTALWLTEVEGGSPEQVGPVLGLSRAAAADLADRAAAGLRDRLAADVADRATDPACRQALAKLPAHAAGRLTAEERDAVGSHLAGCGACAVWLAALISPRPALKRLITPLPAGLTAAVEARWLELLEKRRSSWLAPFTERAVGAAAAAILAVGLGGAAILGARDRGRTAELAAPVATEADGTSGATSIAFDLPDPDLLSAGAAAWGTSRATRPGSTGITIPTFGQLSRGVIEIPSTTPTTTPTAPTPGGSGAPSDPGPPPADPGTPPDSTPDPAPVGVDLLGGTVGLELGDDPCIDVAGSDPTCGPEDTDTTAPLSAEIAVPGLPPLKL